LEARLCPDPLGELIALPRVASNWLQGNVPQERERRGGKGVKGGMEGKGSRVRGREESREERREGRRMGERGREKWREGETGRRLMDTPNF